MRHCWCPPCWSVYHAQQVVSLCDVIDASITSRNHSHPRQSIANLSSEFISKHCHRCPQKSEFLLTVILLYHNECDMLYYQTSAWLRLPKDLTDKILFLVVNDHSLIPACSCIPYAPQNSNAVVDVIRIDSSNIWNIGGLVHTMHAQTFSSSQTSMLSCRRRFYDRWTACS